MTPVHQTFIMVVLSEAFKGPHAKTVIIFQKKRLTVSPVLTLINYFCTAGLYKTLLITLNYLRLLLKSLFCIQNVYLDN